VPLVTVDPSSATPPFEQVRSQLAAAIETGTVAPAERLPPVRRLASDLGLAVNTVARAYRELELAGYVETRGRHGTFVEASPSPTRWAARDAARTFVRAVRALGVGDAEALALLRREFDDVSADGSAGASGPAPAAS
jgi:DNA-binding transcriptional regulator YhcF (GntR family)